MRSAGGVLLACRRGTLSPPPSTPTTPNQANEVPLRLFLQSSTATPDCRSHTFPHFSVLWRGTPFLPGAISHAPNLALWRSGPGRVSRERLTDSPTCCVRLGTEDLAGWRNASFVELKSTAVMSMISLSASVMTSHHRVRSASDISSSNTVG